MTQTGVKMHQGVREKLAELVCYREGINAHLTAAIELAQPSPGGLLMPNQPCCIPAASSRARSFRR